jgi:GxxExxY protein
MERREVVDPTTNEIARRTVDAAFLVHRALGPGLLESVYEECLAAELDQAGLPYQRQVALPVIYKHLKLGAGFRIDLLVDRCVIVDIKAVETLAPLHTAQVLTYLRLSQRQLGYLMNFNVAQLKDGLKRLVL